MTEQNKNASRVVTLNERENNILRFLIEQYIRDGQPVGSRTLSKISGLDLSAATIRNVMGDLEEMGLLCAPHTSAGRVPTSQAYRLFVDSLLKVKRGAARNQLIEEIGFDLNLPHEHLLHKASEHLSRLTAMTGLVTLPRRQGHLLRQIEFLSLSENRVLVILVTQDGEVQNRIIQLERALSNDELQEAANYINVEHLGKSLTQMRDRLREDLEQMRDAMHEQTKRVISAAGDVIDDAANPSDDDAVIVAGQTNLLTFTELSDVDKLKALFETFNSKRDVYQLLERSLVADGVQIFIGQESGHAAFDDLSLVTANYTRDDEVIGVLGVVGPTRMAYDQVIPIVDVTARLLSAALSQGDSFPRS